MRIGIVQTLKTLWNVDHHERIKMLFLGGTFFSIIASYTIIKDLKDAIFINIVGVLSVPVAKSYMIIGIFPLVLLFSILVDKFRRYQLLCYSATFYGVVGLISAGVIYYGGLGNRVVAPYSLYWFFGWIYYFYIESFSPFVVSVFWSFLNSISTPDNAKKNYGLIVSVSKMGGMVTSGFAWFILSYNNHGQAALGCTETDIHCLLIVISSLLLFLVPVIVWKMMHVVPGKFLHGYEQAYRFEKTQSKQGKDETGMWSGFVMLLKYPYIFGIFCITFFYETVSVVLSYLRLDIAFSATDSLSGMSSFLFKTRFITHFIGLIISLLGTRILTMYLGERFSLLLMPVTLGGLMVWYAFSPTSAALITVFGVCQAMHYAFSQPVTEALYIPTVKDMKFKSKSWIDTFGKRSARFIGSQFNVFIFRYAAGFVGLAYTIFFTGIIGTWVAVSYALGKKYEEVIKKGEVIGAEEA